MDRPRRDRLSRRRRRAVLRARPRRARRRARQARTSIRLRSNGRASWRSTRSRAPRPIPGGAPARRCSRRRSPATRHARPVMGTAASVAALTPAALAARFAETHGGAAMTVVVVGDVDAGAIAAVKRAFGAIPRGRAAGGGRDRVPRTPARVTVTSGAGAPPEIVARFPAPRSSASRTSPRWICWPPCSRAATARACSASSSATASSPTACARSASARATAGLVAFAVTPAPRRIAQAAEAALDLAAARRAGARGRRRARSRARRAGERSRAGGGGAAGARAPAGLRRRDRARRRRPRQYLEAIRTAGPAELQDDRGGEILNVDHLTLAVALPDGAPAGRDETAAALTPRLEAMVAAAPALAEKHATARRARRRRRRRRPLRHARRACACSCSATAARRWSRCRRPGSIAPDGLETAGDDAAPVIAALLERGTRTRSRRATSRPRSQAIGGVFKGFAAPGTLGLRADFLPQHLGRGLALVADCLARPAFRGARARRAPSARRWRGRETMRRAGEAASRAALRLFGETLWPDAARRAEADAPPALGRFALLDRYRRRYPLSRLVVAVVGNVDPAAVAAALTNAFPRHRTRPRAADRRARPRIALSPLRGERARVRGPRSRARRRGRPPCSASTSGTDSAAVVGYPTFAPADPNRPPIEVLAEILAGEGGRARGARSPTSARWPAGPARACRARGRPGYLAITRDLPAGAPRRGAWPPCAPRSRAWRRPASRPTR